MSVSITEPIIFYNLPIPKGKFLIDPLFNVFRKLTLWLIQQMNHLQSECWNLWEKKEIIYLKKVSEVWSPKGTVAILICIFPMNGPIY